MRAKKTKQETPKESVINAIGGVTNAVKKMADAMGQLPADKFPEINEDQNIVPGLDPVEIEQPAGAFEIIPGMSVEEMTAMFFDGALIETPYKVWQLNSKGHRYYYKFDDNGTPEFYPSVTTILSQTMPQSPFLIKWIADKGIDEAEKYKAERAAYGTFMHAQFEELIINRVYDLDGLKAKLKDYIDNNKLPADFIYYADDLRKDVLAFAQFVLDYDVKPLAVEIALVHPIYNYAGMIDLPCTMLAKPGSKDYINAIVDFKSGRKGFYEEAEIQLHLYKMMWNENFPDVPIERVFNFSPKDWRKKPMYNLKDQTDSPNAQKIPYLLELAAIEDAKRDNTFTAVTGEICLDAKPDLCDNVTSLTLAELIRSKAPAEKKKPEPDKAVTVEDLKPEPDQKKQMTCSEFEVTINDVAPYSLLEVTDIAEINGVELVEKGLNLDQHRWYSIATNIYKCSDGYVKVTGAYQSFSEAQTWEDINVFSEAEKLQGKELQAFELRMKAYEIENAPEQSPEPKPEQAKAKTTKRTARKKENEAENKPAKAKITVKRTIVPKEKKTPEKAGKQPKNVNGSDKNVVKAEKTELLNDEMEI